MADQGRLDELKRKFDENPKRYFAPLANEYRKAGQPELAIELCRTFLPQQPTHMSGYIVYGQALHDAGRADEAAAVFKQALTLDPENIIALRHLGDIARDAADRGGAMRWYGKVLELDPRNEEIASLIGALAEPGARTPPSGPERTAPPTIRPEPEPDASAVRLEDIVSEPDFAQPPVMHETVSETIEVFRSETSWGAGFAGTDSATATNDAETDGTEPDLGAGIGDGAEPDAPFEVTQWPTALGGTASPDAQGEDTTDIIEGPWHSHSHASETPAEGIAEFGAAQDESLQQPKESRSSDEAARASSEYAEPEPPARSTESASPFVTETMAELYMQQGLRGEALSIYRQLALRRDDPRLHERIAELESAPKTAAHAETVREFFRRIGNAKSHERVQLAAGRPSSLSALFGGAPPASGDASAAEKLAGAFGQPRPGSSHS